MNISPSAAAASLDSATQAQGPTDFDQAIRDAQDGLTDQEMTALIEGAVKAAGSMLIMPKANEILGEVLSDD